MCTRHQWLNRRPQWLSVATWAILATASPVLGQEGAPAILDPLPDAAEQQQADPVPPEPSSYSADGRRDPFVSLLSRGADLRPNINRPTGLGGLSISEVSLRGIFRSQGTVVAIVQSPDNKTYLVHSGDRLLDGVVGSVGDGSVVFLQEVNDPLSLVKQREVRKALRAAAEER